MKRILRRLILAVVVPIATPGTIGTVPAADNPPSQKAEPARSLELQVEQLVRKLDSNSRAERLAAEKGLSELGPDGLEYFPAPAELSSPATREAVRRLRVQLELAKARSSVMASRASLPGPQSLEKMLQTLSQQTGNSIVAPLSARSLNQKINLERHEVTFWEGIEALAVQSGFQFGALSSGEIRLNAGEASLPLPQPLIPGELAATHSGAFRIGLQSARIRPKVSEAIPRRLRFELSLLCEPRLRPLFLKFANGDFRAESAQKDLLKPTSPTAKIELPFGDRGAIAQFDFDLPDGIQPESASLSGKFVALTAAGPERFEFAGLAESKGVSRRKGGVTVAVEGLDIKQSQGDVQAAIAIVVAYETGGPAFESHRSWIFQNEAWIETADKKRVEMSEQPRTTRQSDGAIAIGYQFAGLPTDLANCRFIYVAPTLLIDVPVEFKFHGIPVAAPLAANQSTP